MQTPVSAAGLLAGVGLPGDHHSDAAAASVVAGPAHQPRLLVVLPQRGVVATDDFAAAADVEVVAEPLDSVNVLRQLVADDDDVAMKIAVSHKGVDSSSYDLAAVSHDLAAVSNDLVAVSHDLAAVSHDLVAVSHDLVAVSHDLAAVSYDLVAVSHDLVVE